MCLSTFCSHKVFCNYTKTCRIMITSCRFQVFTFLNRLLELQSGVITAMTNNFKLSYFLRRCRNFSYFWIHYKSINVVVSVASITFVILKTINPNNFPRRFCNHRIITINPRHRWPTSYRPLQTDHRPLKTEMSKGPGLVGPSWNRKKNFPCMESRPGCSACSLVTTPTELWSLDNCFKLSLHSYLKQVHTPFFNKYVNL
jgi:hypothetical protein